VKHSQNKQLIQLMNMIRSKNIYIRNILLDENSRKKIFIDEYELISEAIINGNEEQAELLMGKHVQTDLDIWRKFYIKKGEL